MGGSTAWLLWGVLFGAIGIGYFVYGRKQHNPIPLWTGVALMVFPYFIDSTYIVVAVGALLVAVPLVIRK